ncbi:MAG: PQQ-binding-like beta-propeller repeat protein [Candidatus Bathyarchaeales archaeon]
MKNSTNKTLATIVLILALTSIMLVTTSVQMASAQLAAKQPYSGPLKQGDVPDFTVATTAYLSVRPSLVGLNQLVLVNLWIIPAPNAQREFRDLKVTITKPNGNQEVLTMDSYPADGTAWFEWVVDQVGEWKFKFEFPGMYFPAGRYLAGDIINATTGGSLYTQSVYYKPSSTKETIITVQENIVYSWPESPLPTDYWTRPIPLEKREWWTIAGNYPWHGPGGGSVWDKLYPNTNPYWSAQYRFIPWVQGPNTAHVAWVRDYNLGGIVQFGDYLKTFTLTVSVGYPSIIYMGRCYHSLTKTMPDGTEKSVLQCYDLRTGEIYWERASTTAPTVIEYDRGTPETPGGEPRQMALTGAVRLVYIGGGRLIKYDPWSGAVAGNYSISPLTTGTYYRNGYVLTVQDLGAAAAPNRYRLINWTTFGTSSTISGRIQSNKTYARSSLPSVMDFQSGVGATSSKLMVAGAPANTTVIAYDLWTGTQLWNVTVPEWSYSTSCFVADHGKIALLMEQGYWMAWDARTGNLAWKSEKMDYPWGEPAYGSYSVQSAYGLLFRQSYDGLYAFNWTNGKIVWKYVSPADASYETPYIDENGTTVYSFMNGALIADGKVYVMNSEHTPTVPTTRGWGVHCINVTTGELIWKMRGPWLWSSSSFPGAIADGYLVAASTEGRLFVFGKGKSQTSVSVSQDVVSNGSTVLVKGSVLDMSPAQPGTPCVSKESMSTWMEYLHFQYPIDGIWHNETITGVPVTLTAIGEDGSYFDIGTVVTDGYSGTFAAAWTPPKEGTYRIVASFEGDDSYGSSSATTWITVGPAPPEPETPEIPTPTDYMPMLTGLTIAVIIAIVIGIYSIYDHRKMMRK